MLKHQVQVGEIYLDGEVFLSSHVNSYKSEFISKKTCLSIISSLENVERDIQQDDVRSS